MRLFSFSPDVLPRFLPDLVPRLLIAGAGLIAGSLILTSDAQASDTTLREVVTRRLSGLALEEAEQGSWNRWRRQSREFVDFRRGKMTVRQKLDWLASCFTRPEENSFCEFISKTEVFAPLPSPPRPSGSGDEDAAERAVDRSADALAARVRRGDLDSLGSVPEAMIHKALKTFSRWEDLQRAAGLAISMRRCPSPALLTALGLKAEEFFPGEELRATAEKLYSRAMSCASAPAEAEKARFRIALLQVWKGECQSALSQLEQLSSVRGGDYATRSLYWMSYCGRELQDDELVFNASRKLTQDYPMSYHSLLLGSSDRRRVRELFAGRESGVLFRSKARPDLNSSVRVVEALQALPLGPSEMAFVRDLSQEVLESLGERLSGSETGFRLYAAALMARTRSDAALFKNLASIFRDDPMAISRSTLELFYPLRRFEELRRYGAKVDPFLIAALIRQESSFNEKARSPVGALGLMQLMPGTARRFERVSPRELLDAKTNIRLGTRYFDQLLARYRGDAELALAAYNAGPEKVDSWLRRYPIANRALFFDLIPFRETRDYVALISRNYFWYRSLYSEKLGSRALASMQPRKRQLVFTLDQD